MNNAVAAQTVLLTLIRSAREIPRARLLIDSIRSFGGDWCDCPIWLFEANPQVPCASLAGAGVQVLPLNMPDALRCYDFGDKVCACAQAEAMATGVQSLVWADPGVLFLQPPRLYDLDTSADAAVRPVHIKNVGYLLPIRWMAFGKRCIARWACRTFPSQWILLWTPNTCAPTLTRTRLPSIHRPGRSGSGSNVLRCWLAIRHINRPVARTSAIRFSCTKLC